jgi:hypothetical protein
MAMVIPLQTTNRMEIFMSQSSNPGPVEASFERDYPAPEFKPAWKKPQINRLMAQDFVVAAHMDLDLVRHLLGREPGLANATMDWGGGDWETAIGAASHMGRADIVELLMAHGATPDIFCAAMLGKLEVVKGIMEMEPGLIDAKGPHGFGLHFHATVGGHFAKAVLNYLQGIKEVEVRVPPFMVRRG